jgi:hypothetical protein
MKSFMISGSFTRCMELDKDPSGSDTMPLLGEDAAMTVYGGRLPLERHRMSKLSPGPQLIVVWDAGAQGCKGTNCVCVCVNLYIMAAPKANNNNKSERRQDG